MASIILSASSRGICRYSNLIAGVRCGTPLDEYTMLLLRTQMWIAFCTLACPSLSPMVSSIGIIRDLEDPDRAMVEMRVAAKHSWTPGTTPEMDLQAICHLSSVIAEVRKLKKPSWA